MSNRMKLILTGLGIGAVLVGWGVAWANQNARISTNSTNIDALSKQVGTVSSQATEADKAIVRMETKIEYIVKGIDEIKAEIRAQK